MKIYRNYHIFIVTILLLTGCAGQQSQLEDPNKKSNLAKQPIGLHVQKVREYGGMTYSDITVRNNSGRFLEMLYIEVLVYDSGKRVGMTNNIFNSVNPGETMVKQKPVITDGRPWDSWKFTYKVR